MSASLSFGVGVILNSSVPRGTVGWLINISRICLRGTEAHTISDTISLEQVANANFHDPVTVTAQEQEQVTPTAYLFQ